MSIKLEKDEEENDDEKLLFPFEIKDIDPILNSELLEKFQGDHTGGFIQVGHNKWFFPKNYANNAKYYYNFKTRPDDVFVISYPRSGTTWTQEMVWLLSNNLDYKKAKEIWLHVRYTFLEFSSICDEISYNRVMGNMPPGWKILNQQSSDEKRFIKTHLPLELLPPDLLQNGPKIVYVARNPKDVIVSYYHFVKCNPFYGFTGDFPELWWLIRQNLIHWSPYWEHVKEAWNRRNESENFMFIFYEDMQKDLKSTLIKVATFLEQCYTSEQLDELAEHLKFENFKNNKSVDVFQCDPLMTELEENEDKKFIRKGKVGNWKKYFNEEMDKEADEWIAQNLKDSDLRFPINMYAVY